MSDYTMLETSLQLGGRVKSIVDLSTGAVLPPVAGLSKCHISPGFSPSSAALAGGTAEHSSPFYPAGYEGYDPIEPKLFAWVGGSLLKFHAGGMKHSRSSAGRGGLTINPPFDGEFNEKGKQVPVVEFDVEVNEGSTRGKITGFSWKSRLRMMYKLGKIQKSERPIFVTITYPDEFPDDPKVWAVHLDRFRKRFKRRGWGAVWKKEIKRRQSGINAGKLAPHFHLLVWGAKYQDLRNFVAAAWYQIVGSGDKRHLAACARVEYLDSYEHGVRYIGKYTTKDLDTEADDLKQAYESIGRCWGVINSEVLPWAEIVRVFLPKQLIPVVFRYMRRYAHIHGKAHLPSLTILCSDPWRWVECLTGNSTYRSKEHVS